MTTATGLENERFIEAACEAHLKRRNGAQRPVTRQQIVNLVRIIGERLAEQQGGGRPPFEFAKAIRGLCAIGGTHISETSEGDAKFVRALATTGTPGSYLVPVIQANAIISQLAQMAVARIAGATIWPIPGQQELNVPATVTSQTAVWNAQNSKQTPDAAWNLGQLAFDLKPLTSFLLLPLQLFKTSMPAFDVILGDSFALACAEAEDAALFASSQTSNAPPNLMSAAITTINCQSSASGGNIGYSDVLAVLLKASQLKLRGPLAWFCSPRTLYTRLLGLQDTTSRPLLIPDVTEGASGYSLMGYPVYVTTSILENETLGSGSNQSHLILAPPRAIHIAENHAVSMDVAMEYAFDAGQVGVRVGHGTSFQYGPAAAIIALLGIN